MKDNSMDTGITDTNAEEVERIINKALNCKCDCHAPDSRTAIVCCPDCGSSIVQGVTD